MSREKLQQEYRSHWEAELKRRDQLNQAIGLPITLITGLGGAGYIFARDLHHPLDGRAVLILLFVVLSWSFLSVAVVKVMQLVFGHAYAFPPTPKSFEDNRTKLESYYTERSEIRTVAELDSELLERLHARYIDDSDQNARCNDVRSKYLYDSKKLIVVAMALTAIAGAAKATGNLSLKNLRADFSALCEQTEPPNVRR
jgi:hypothetical protein